ncbi:SCO family protein [Paucibacter sp. Y2R2-4]|uniref:SCO family protein n=1 Tax=Paucibacter sp. Y2R2-4 TaxID=2893553 RepID=UPI0021E42EEE|nr:SCO family protein [Paucibacter sp. Y2R2-4]MCV2349768.1 SCO family protein [Paucibacter sp. Y2R2-4]
MRLTVRFLLRMTLVAGLAAGLAACDQLGSGSASKPAFQGVDLTGAEYARSLNLSDQDGRSRSLGEFKGKVVVVFFGYTQCPDVCPTTLAELAEVKRSLGADGDRVQGVFVTVDPERDSAALLKSYVASFDSGFVALRGSEEQTKAAAKEFKVYYAKVPGKTPESYTMDHTAASFIFDAQGRVRVFSRYGSGASALANDIKLLLAEKS